MKRSSIHFLSFLFLLFISLAATSAFGQLESGSVNGIVVDSSGSAVVGAKVTISDLGTTVAQTATTDEHGSYHFATLRPSHYRIAASAAGFKESVIQDVELHTQVSISESITLQVGSTGDTVSVNAQTEQLETSAAISTTVDRAILLRICL